MWVTFSVLAIIISRITKSSVTTGMSWSGRSKETVIIPNRVFTGVSASAGGKFHSNSEIADIIYLSLRRSRVDFESSAFSIFHNSGFEYTYEMDSRTLDSIQHTFIVSKKWPWKRFKAAFALDLGFIFQTKKKYSGSLREEENGEEFTVILRPNIEF